MREPRSRARVSLSRARATGGKRDLFLGRAFVAPRREKFAFFAIFYSPRSGAGDGPLRLSCRRVFSRDWFARSIVARDAELERDIRYVVPTGIEPMSHLDK